MARSNPLLWSKLPAIWSYWIAVASVAAALMVSRWPVFHLQEAPVSLFLCAVILSAWFGGLWPGLLATGLSALAFYYYFLPPVYSLHAKPEEIPRFTIFMVSALFVGSLRVAQREAGETPGGRREPQRNARGNQKNKQGWEGGGGGGGGGGKIGRGGKKERKEKKGRTKKGEGGGEGEEEGGFHTL